MLSPKSLIIIPLVASILFAGCSVEDIFSKLATTNEEQGASEAFNRSKIIEAKQLKMEQMKQQFPDFVNLNNVTESISGVGVAYRKLESASSQIILEAMLPNSNRQIYEVWLNKTGSKDKLRLGALQFIQTDDYTFTYTSGEDLSSYSNISISLEAVPDDIQETVIMTGTFSL